MMSERLVSKLKNWRRVATRYGKTLESYLGIVILASVILWMPFVRGPSNRYARRRPSGSFLATDRGQYVE